MKGVVFVIFQVEPRRGVEMVLSFKGRGSYQSILVGGSRLEDDRVPPEREGGMSLVPSKGTWMSNTKSLRRSRRVEGDKLVSALGVRCLHFSDPGGSNDS